MANEHDKAEPARNTENRDRPAYDNPADDKGELAAGSNARKPRGPAKPRNEPIGHASDKKLHGLRQ